MRKLRLEYLRVESFNTTGDSAGGVFAHYGKNSIYNCEPVYSETDSGVGRTCRASCHTCRRSGC